MSETPVKSSTFIATQNCYVNEQYVKAGEVVLLPSNTKAPHLTKVNSTGAPIEETDGDGLPFDVAVPAPVAERLAVRAAAAPATVRSHASPRPALANPAVRPIAPATAPAPAPFKSDT